MPSDDHARRTTHDDNGSGPMEIVKVLVAGAALVAIPVWLATEAIFHLQYGQIIGLFILVAGFTVAQILFSRWFNAW